MAILKWKTDGHTVQFYEPQADESEGQSPSTAPESRRLAAEDEATADPPADPVPQPAEQDARLRPASSSDPALRKAEVAFWALGNGYGFLTPGPDGPKESDVSAHWSVLEGWPERFPYLAKGEPVFYELAPEPEPGDSGRARWRASRVLPARARRRGIVDEYGFDLGYGTMTGDDGKRYFLHQKNVVGVDFPELRPGDEVFFVVGDEDARRGGPLPVAVDIKVGDARPALHRFAEFPNDPARWLEPLARRASDEQWNYRHENTGTGGPFPVLRNYMEATFERLLDERDQGRSTIVEGVTDAGEPYAVFDTGLVDDLAQPIYALFTDHRDPTDPRRWFWRGFYTEGRGEMRHVARLPEPANYLSDTGALVISPEEIVAMRIDTKHIIVEHLDRFPSRFQEDTALARMALEAQLRILPGLVRRDYRLAVPQYYRREIQLLLPLHLGNPDERPRLALVVGRPADGPRRAATVAGLDYAYQQARIVARPDTSWLGRAWHASAAS